MRSKSNQKGMSLPINSTAVLVLILMFVALFFAMVSGVVNEEVDRFLDFTEDNSPDTVVGTSLESENQGGDLQSVSDHGEFSFRKGLLRT